MTGAEGNRFPCRVMRLNRPPAVGPPAGTACGEAPLFPAHKSRTIDGEGEKASLRCSGLPEGPHVGPVVREEHSTASHHCRPHTMTTRQCVDNANAMQRVRAQDTPSLPRAAADHLEGGAALVADSPHLLYAGRRPAPHGVCTAMAQHVELFRDSTPDAPVCGRGDQSRQARLAMLRGSGPLW